LQQQKHQPNKDSSSFVSSSLSSYQQSNSLEKSIIVDPDSLSSSSISSSSKSASSANSEKEIASQKRNTAKKKQHSQRRQQQQQQRQQHQLKEINLYLIGYSKINYLKDNYFCLCEYLTHSVYDSKSLENFELKQYLSLLSNAQFDFTTYYKKTIKCLNKSNSFYSYYHNVLSNLAKQVVPLPPIRVEQLNGESSSSSSSSSSPSHLDYELIDCKISKAFKCVNLPSDWTLLGQVCYLKIG
jgi:hypothetical protein